MTAERTYMQVLLPVKLRWIPTYGSPVPLEPGRRVCVELGGRRYDGVVWRTLERPDLPPERIQDIVAVQGTLPAVTPEELRFWSFLSDYYLCTLGEVYKAAYPELSQHKSRLALQENEPPRGVPALSPDQERASAAIGQGFAAGKTVLLNGFSGPVCLKLAVECLEKGRSVLYLAPEIGLSSQLEAYIRQSIPSLLVYHSGLTAGKRKRVAQVLRTGQPCMVLGTRSALFLPFRQLGLIIVDQEHDTSYKQDSPAPRYHARESAILLSRIHHARVLLCSPTPSFESLYNAQSGLFARVDLQEPFVAPELQVIDLSAESRKRGLSGSFSLKLLEQMHRTLDEGKEVLLVCRAIQAVPECTEELRAIFGERPRIVTTTPAGAKLLPYGHYGLVAVLQADSLLAKEDFRCDERAHQVLFQLRDRCVARGAFMVQTREPAHPVFGAFTQDRTQQLMAERRQFGYPPYTRLVYVNINDNNTRRGVYMARELARLLMPQIPGTVLADVQIRLMLPRDKMLLHRKQLIYSTVMDFEKTRKYVGHIHIDVDPV